MEKGIIRHLKIIKNRPIIQVFLISYWSIFLLKPKRVAGNETDKFSCDWERLDGPEIESQWGARFSSQIYTGSGAQPASYTYNVYRVSFPGVKRPERGVDYQPYLAPKLKKE